jgi:hypothetical protein
MAKIEIDRDQVKQYFEFVGRITVEFSVLELLAMELLAVLINNSNRDIAYFMANEYDKKPAQKFELLERIINKEIHTGYIEDEIRNNFLKVLKKVSSKRLLRNKIIHSMIIFNKTDDENIYSETLEFNIKRRILERKKGYNIKDLSELFTDLLDLQYEFNKFYEHVTTYVL